MSLIKNIAPPDLVSQTDLWATPQPLFNKIVDRFGEFTLDPCCTIETAKCEKFYTPVENGLIQDWSGEVVFANPPYSRYNVDKWVTKFFHESMGAKVIALLPASTSSDWFQNYCLGQSKYFIDKRVKFAGAIGTPNFSSVIILFNHIDKSYSFKQ